MGVAKSPKSSSGSGSKLFPPGFRFHPTDEELILYYLKRKICRRRLKPDMIAETDVYKWDPDDLPDLSKLQTGDRQWFFLSPRDRRYPNGGRSNRATMRGYWKATGKDRTISSNSRLVGLKKTLVYYEGRAPSGKRTDWVMHEYTLDQAELNRCPSPQDYYVLYKLYKKSGLGPKNGEDYGAPFKEEEWVDVECVSFSGLLDQHTVTKEADFSCIDNTRNILPQDHGDDIGEFLNKIVDETVFDPPPLNVYSYTSDQFIAEKENGSTLLNHCSGEVGIADQSMVPHQYPHSDVRASFDPTYSLASQLPIQATEVVASTKNGNEGSGEISIEDFLEMDDLHGPEPNVQNVEAALGTPSSNGTGGFAAADIYNDLSMILNGMGQGGPEQISQPYFSNGEMSNVVSHSYVNTVENGYAVYDEFTFQNEVNMTSSQVWAPEQSSDLFTPATNNPAGSQPIYGVCNGEGASLSTGAIHNQSCTVDDSTDSWFSTALWSFVESIPTTPASASENALVNKAFERMSSFSRLKTKTAACNSTPTPRRRVQKFVGGMFSFSVIGIVFAILWLLIATSVKLLGGYIAS